MPHKEDVNSLIHVTESNNLVMPNDRVLLNELQPQVKYRNVKTEAKQLLSDNNILPFHTISHRK